MAHPTNANDSHSEILKRLSKFMSTAKTVFHLIDDPLVATEKALNITDPGFMLAADTVVASVFLIVSGIELHESIKELQELNEEYDELKNHEDEETLQKKAKIKKRMRICYGNIFLSGGAFIASAMLLICTAASLTFGGIAFFPFAIMMAILTKQCSEFFAMNNELKQLLTIEQLSPEQIKKMRELQNDIFYKKMEITAQALITFGFLASVVAVSIFSAGMAPTLFVIGGAIFGLIFKLHGKYHANKVEKAELQENVSTLSHENAALKAEVHQLKQEREEFKKTPSNLCRFSALSQPHRAKDDFFVGMRPPVVV